MKTYFAGDWLDGESEDHAAGNLLPPPYKAGRAEYADYAGRVAAPAVHLLN